LIAKHPGLQVEEKRKNLRSGSLGSPAGGGSGVDPQINPA